MVWVGELGREGGQGGVLKVSFKVGKQEPAVTTSTFPLFLAFALTPHHPHTVRVLVLTTSVCGRRPPSLPPTSWRRSGASTTNRCDEMRLCLGER